ncbi:hypothetical protein N7603_07705 [Acholeplasma vituli]|uniref:Uncharacterized protein n=1 Tax=Paracholeplasma vituli TaxID=69473 RepID=A0ABT2Q0L8_9MOLU|nr:hypothetical protein [Paracholeplasma vituli]MCU0105542.1 hypothetical protein [Paracholeplasma vituli]
MEEYTEDLSIDQKLILDELLAHVEKRTQLKPVIQYSLPAFKITNDVVIAFDITATYLGLYTTDNESIQHAKGRLKNAIFGVTSIKVDRTSREAIEAVKDICDEIIMRYRVFNSKALIEALDDKNPEYSEQAFLKLMDLLEENEIADIDYLFLLRHPKRNYISFGIQLLSKSLKYDSKNKYDGYLNEYFELLNLPYFTTIIEVIDSCQTWIRYKPYMKQTIKNHLKTLDISYFKDTQQDKIKVEIEKILQL